jgi:ABC-type multidrug transport system, ATPase and permease components
MDFFHEEENTEGKIFNRDVLGLLVKYIIVYKKYFAVSVLFVVIITGATLSVPYITKIIIDRFIVKQGSLICVTSELFTKHDASMLHKKLAKGIAVSDSTYFMMQSELSFFSGKKLQQLTHEGALSAQKYTLIESPALDPVLETKIKRLAKQGEIKIISSSQFLFSAGVMKQFSVNEIMQLRAADLHRAGLYVLLVLGIFIVQFMASYLQIVSLMNLSQKAMRDLRRDLFAHVLSLEISYFDKNPIGRLVNRVTNDIEALNEMFSSVLITFFQDLLILAGITAIMFATDVTLALVIAVSFPFLIVITVVFRVKARNAYRTIRTKIAALNAVLNESISGIRIVQIFVQELKQIRNFAKINKAVFDSNMQQIYIYGIFRPLIEFFRWFCIAGVIFIGAHLIMTGRISYGLVVMFLSYIGTFFEPIGDLAEKFDTLQSATAAGEKILLLFNAPARRELSDKNSISSFNQAHELRFFKSSDGALRLDGEVRFDDVWFSYKPDEWVLKGVSFSIKKNQTLAIVGETGSGKTTIVNLLSRFYPIQKGAISIDGINVNDIPYSILRANIAMVMQDVFLFSRTIAENIMLGSSSDERKLNLALQISHCNKFIRGLKNGAREMVMERGATFSAGERQLLAFARALYFDPAILVLDEATSNIDTETERLIQDATAQLIRGRTSLIIAHRLSTIRSADTIIVLKHGKIIEQGDHQSLLAEKGMYYELYKLQFEAV